MYVFFILFGLIVVLLLKSAPPRRQDGAGTSNKKISKRAKGKNTSTCGLTDIEDLIGVSLIPSTLKRMKIDGFKPLSLEDKLAKRKIVEEVNVPKFSSVLQKHSLKLQRKPTEVFQLNIGLYCNQACSHCHVDSSPKRKEMMHREVAEQCISIIKNSPSIKTIDLTGGAPELNQQFKFLVKECRKLGKEVIDRCNLTVLLEPNNADLISFLCENQVRIIASLPCYLEENVDQQRGSGAGASANSEEYPKQDIFKRSIKALQLLNAAGYGPEGDKELKLDLVYNPTGIHLPPAQEKLELDYKRELKEKYGIHFNNLFCITNMPINRYTEYLLETGKLEEYMNILVNNFNASSCESVMCTSYTNVSWDGVIYDCDFNAQIELDMRTAHSSTNSSTSSKLTVFDITSTDDLLSIPIATAKHCFGCTAGAGSSCQGATLS